MLNVFLTVDTELWPKSPGWPANPLPETKMDFTPELNQFIYGNTRAGNFGLPYQLTMLAQYGLKATFFVETLFANRVGLGVLKGIVELIQRHDQEIGLHAHTEWLGEFSAPGLPARFGPLINEYTHSEQASIIAHAKTNLVSAGAPAPRCFRAGSYGANLATLDALAVNDIYLDSSYNPCCLESFPDRPANEQLQQPRQIGDVCELPISSFADYPGHRRHAQLGACSRSEMQAALLSAHKAGWDTFVIVLHSSELIKRFQPGGHLVNILPDSFNIARFENLCRFLDANRDKFRSISISEWRNEAHAERPVEPATSPIYHTVWRNMEQLARRIM